MAHLKIENLTKIIDNNLILDKINMEVNNQEFISILGESGAGKSMLLNCIAGFIDSNEGKIMVDGIDITKKEIKEREFVMVDQDVLLFEHMSVFDNIAFGLKTQKVAKEVIEKTVEELAINLEIVDYLKRFPHQLSGGQQQRVAIARALAIKPKILLLDEPFNKLDTNLRESMQNLIKRINVENKITIILVTHDKNEALKLSDRIAIISEGKLIDYDVPHIIYNYPTNIETLKFLGEMNIIDANIFGVQDKEYVIINPKKIKVVSEGERVKVVDKIYLGNTYQYSILYKNKLIYFESDNDYDCEYLNVEITMDNIYFY